MKDSYDVFKEFCDCGCLDICGDPGLLAEFSDSLLADVSDLALFNVKRVKPDDFDRLVEAQDNFAHVANLLAYVLKSLVVEK